MYGDNPPVTFDDSPLYTRGPETDCHTSVSTGSQ
mgnify:FL=1